MKVLDRVYMSLVFVFLYLPIFVLIVFSFNNSKSRSVWSGFTFRWYMRLFENKEIISAFSNTIIIAVVASILATVLGTTAAIGIIKTRGVVKKIIMAITNIPMINPEIVTGVSLMILFVLIYNTTGLLEPGIVTMIIAHTTFCLPYVILSVIPKLRQLDPNLYEAAQDLGCTPAKAFFKVVFPEILPGIITGGMMAFTMSIDDFVISYFTSGTTKTLPITIYSMTRKIVSPEINALSTILFSVIFVLLFAINIRQIKSKKVKEN